MEPSRCTRLQSEFVSASALQAGPYLYAVRALRGTSLATSLVRHCSLAQAPWSQRQQLEACGDRWMQASPMRQTRRLLVLTRCLQCDRCNFGERRVQYSKVALETCKSLSYLLDTPAAVQHGFSVILPYFRHHNSLQHDSTQTPRGRGGGSTHANNHADGSLCRLHAMLYM